MPGQYKFSVVTCRLVVIALLGLSGCRDETRTAALAPPEAIVQTVAGQVIKQTFEPGQKVKEGEPLFSIDPRAYEETVIDAQAKLAEAEAVLARSRQDVERYKPLLPDNAIPRQALITVCLALGGGWQAQPR